MGINIDSIDTLAKVSIVLILVSILGYLSENHYHELYIHKLVIYFDFRTSNFMYHEKKRMWTS